MALLMLFALVAGAGTALSPCVLPILPAILSAGVTGGRRRPLGVVTGLALSFTFATVALVYVINALGLPNGFARDLAIVVLFAFGITLLIPPIGDRVEAFASRLAPGPARFRGDGFGSGFIVGASLGLVYAPCAGPILAGVIVVSAAQDFTAGPPRRRPLLRGRVRDRAVPAAARGRRLTSRLNPVRGRVQMATGRGDGAGRGRDDRQPRHTLPDRDRRATCPASSSIRPRGWRRARRLHRDREGEPARARRSSPPTSSTSRSACRPTARRPTSPGRRTGSTRRAASRSR